MPRGDGSGPQGLGPMTGRGLGYCAGYSVSGLGNSAGCGLGRGMGRGGRGGFRPAYAGFAPPVNRTFPTAMPDEAAVLKSHVSALEEQLAAVKARLDEIDDTKTPGQ